MNRTRKNGFQKEVRKFEKDYAKVMIIIYSMSWKMRVHLALRLLFKFAR